MPGGPDSLFAPGDAGNPHGTPPQAGPENPYAPPQGDAGNPYVPPQTGSPYGPPQTGSPYGPPPQAGAGNPYAPPGQGAAPQFGPPQFGQPQYQQFGQPGATFGPPVDPKEIRPRLRWIGVAWAVAAACIVAGVALFITGITDSVENLVPATTFRPGEPAVVTLDPADRPALYVATTSRVNYDCAITGGATLVSSPATETISANGRRWELILLINAPRAGEYQLSCSIQQPAADVVFGVGRDVLSAAGGILGGVAALLIIPGVGVLGAIIVTVVVLVRRNGHRKRLAAVG